MAKAARKPGNEDAEAPPLRLEWRSPAELAENPRNWRRHPEAQVSALTEALSEVGWAGALLYNERTGRLIDGHARRKVALDQGAARVPVLVGSWDEERERLVLATLDPLAAMAEADAGALAVLLADASAGGEALRLMLGQLAADGKVHEAGAGEPDDPAGHWGGMPEFSHEDQTAGAAFTVRVFFADEAELEEFGRLIGKDLKGRKFVWFRKQPMGTTYEAAGGAPPP